VRRIGHIPASFDKHLRRYLHRGMPHPKDHLLPGNLKERAQDAAVGKKRLSGGRAESILDNSGDSFH